VKINVSLGSREIRRELVNQLWFSECTRIPDAARKKSIIQRILLIIIFKKDPFMIITPPMFKELGRVVDTLFLFPGSINPNSPGLLIVSV